MAVILETSEQLSVYLSTLNKVSLCISMSNVNVKYLKYNFMNSCILYVNADRQLIPVIQWSLIGLSGLKEDF